MEFALTRREKPPEPANQPGYDELIQQIARIQISTADKHSLSQEVSVESLANKQDVVNARHKLEACGVISIKDFFPVEEARALAKMAFTLVDQECDALRNGMNLSRPDYEIISEAEGNYYDLAENAKPVVYQRLGKDNGMIDIFNFDRLSGSKGVELKSALALPLLQELFSKTGKRWRPRNLNVYVNRSVTATRGFHVDSYGGRQVKAFIYLTDVLDETQGPYTYVVGSHLDSAFRQASISMTHMGQPFESTDTPIVNQRSILPFLAPAGTLIVSDQSGAHRGLPQQVGASRVIAVLNFTDF